MTINDKIKRALAPLGLPVKAGVYQGNEVRYMTFNYDLLPCQFVGNRPIYYRALVQVHLFLPLGENGVVLRRQTAEALSGAGFTWPESIDASDEEGQHIVFECEIIDTTKERE